MEFFFLHVERETEKKYTFVYICNFFFFAFYFQIDEFVNDDAHVQLNRKCL